MDLQIFKHFEKYFLSSIEFKLSIEKNKKKNANQNKSFAEILLRTILLRKENIDIMIR